MLARRSVCLAAVGLPALLFAWSHPAQARVSEGVCQVELFMGRYEPDPAAIAADAAFGARFGYNLTQRVNLQGTVGRFDSESGSGGGSVVDVEIVFAEFSVGYHLLANHRFVPIVGVGAGGAEERDRDSLTVHATLGFKLDLSRKVYLRADQRYRRFEGRDHDETDRELSFGLGIRFGN